MSGTHCPSTSTPGHKASRRPWKRTDRTRPRRRFAFDYLEERRLLADFAVTSTGDSISGSGSTGTLRYCLSNIFWGGTIEFELGTGANTIALTSGQLELRYSVSIYNGPGQGPVTINGGGKSRVFQVDPGTKVSLSGMTITGGSTSGFGGGVYNDGGNLTLTDCTVSGNSAGHGGGIGSPYLATTPWNPYGSGSITLTASTVTGNSAKFGGGIYNYGTANISDCTIVGNSAKYGGGAVGSHDSATLIYCTVTGNAAGSGGGLWDPSSSQLGPDTMQLIDTIVAGNSAGNGPDVDAYVTSFGWNLVGDTSGSSGLDSDDITGKGADLGPLGDYGGPTQTMPLLPGSPAIAAGIYFSSYNSPTADQRGFGFNSPAPDIGAFQTNPLVVNTTVDGTGSPFGDLSLRQALSLANLLGAVESITFSTSAFATAQTIALVGGPLVLNDTSGQETITGPSAGLTINGGGKSRVFQVDGGVTASLSGLTISGGSSSGNGGAILNDGALTLDGVSLVQNTAKYGGAIFTQGGSLGLADCTIAGNKAAISGGGIEAQNNLTVVASTFANNVATAGGGGAIDNPNSGGGHPNGTYTITVEDTIFSNDSCAYGPEVANAVVSLGHNLVSNDANSSGWIASDSTGTAAAPLQADLGTLGNYGGPTQTIPLLPGSPAIGKGAQANYPGTFNPITTDQRGSKPLDSTNPDVGAFQSQGFTITPVAASMQQSTPVNRAFTNSLAVRITATNPLEPVAGGVITFAAPSSGASATLSASMATIGNSGQASIKATANGTPGTYNVTALTAGAAPAHFSLTNLAPTAFSSLAAPTIVYGTSTVTLSGTILAGSTAPTGSVSITLAGTTQSAPISNNGHFSSVFKTTGLGVGTSSHTITYGYASSGAFAGTTNTSQVLKVTPAPLTVTAGNATRTFGQANPTFTYKITGFVNNETASVVTGSPGFTTSATASSPPGPYTITPTVGTLATANYSFTKFAPGTLTVVAQATATLAPVVSPIHVVVASVAVTFSEPINASSLVGQDVTLTRNGGGVATTSLTFTSQGGNKYLIGGLSGLTGSDGTYALKFLASSVRDVNDAAGSGSASVSWLMDTTPPTSKVTTLAPQTTSTSFNVPVSATDPVAKDGGPPSGLASIAAYESVNGGSYSLLGTITLSGDPASDTGSVAFTGQVGDTYGFYSIATDAAGNVQPTPAVAQRTVQIVTPVGATTIAPVSPNPTNTAVSSIDVTFSRAMTTGALASAAVTLTDDGNTVAVSGLSLAPVSGDTYAINGLVSLTKAAGLYSLTVNAAGFRDQYGQAGTGTMSTSWLMDPTPPTSTVSPLPKTGTGLVFPVTVAGTVPTFPAGSPAVNIASFDIYVSVNGGSWTLWQKNLAPSSPTSNTATVNYTGAASNTVYAFYATATDTVGNAQAYKPTVEASTDLPNLITPATQVASSSTYNGDGTFTIHVTGTDAGGNGLAYFEVYVAIGAGTPVPIGPVIPAGIANAQGTYSATTTYVMPASEYGITSNSYKFSSVGIDAAGREEPMHAAYDVMIPNVAYSEPSAANLALDSITVENGAAERSFIRTIDLNFNDAMPSVLQSIVNSVNNGSSPELTLTQSGLDGSGSGISVSLKGLMEVIDNAIEIDFGTGGIKNAASSSSADGYYALSFTPAGQGIGSTHHFDRLLGDVNGDGSVDASDVAAITAARGQSLAQIAVAIGQPASGLTPLNMDVNGDGSVNTIDVAVATAAKNRGNSLKKGLPLG